MTMSRSSWRDRAGLLFSQRYISPIMTKTNRSLLRDRAVPQSKRAEPRSLTLMDRRLLTLPMYSTLAYIEIGNLPPIVRQWNHATHDKRQGRVNSETRCY